jgi:hypothetical protein
MNKNGEKDKPVENIKEMGRKDDNLMDETLKQRPIRT